MKHARVTKLVVLTLATWSLLAEPASALITIDTVPVGNGGNAADPTTGYGTVGYDYGIGKYEVTLNQYNTFLNAVAATDAYGLYNESMGMDLTIAGISRIGVSGSYAYSVIGSGNRPVTYVSWYDAARFVNWLHNRQPTGAQAAGTTETGAYMLTGNSGIISRNTGWAYGLPSEDEWYKAAYHQPVGQGGDSDDYWLYPTANNGIPNSRNGSAGDPNSGNFFQDDGIENGFNGGYAANNSTEFPADNALTDAGAFSVADSFYGTFDQGGNVREWNDAIIDDARRGLRGGSWGDDEYLLRAKKQQNGGPEYEGNDVGFRVVMVPEPGVVGIMALGLAVLAWQRKRTLWQRFIRGRKLDWPPFWQNQRLRASGIGSLI
jgi:formylglycine-generating enzyme required for sulfatase activity